VEFGRESFDRDRVSAHRSEDMPQDLWGPAAGERDNEELATHLVALLGNRETRESFGREGRKSAEERLDDRVLNDTPACCESFWPQSFGPNQNCRCRRAREAQEVSKGS
jgi:hypothetical protein